MQPCGPTEMVCPPATIGWSALILWTITVYGVLGILSVFAATVNWRDPTATGARILRLLALLDVGAAAVSPLLVFWVLGAPRLAGIATVTLIALASLCRASARRPVPDALPTARLTRSRG